MKITRIGLLCLGLAYFSGLPLAQAALKIGVLFYDPPLVMSATQGFHVELANKICQGLREQCTILPMKWSRLFTALDKGEIDLQMGVYATPQRSKKYIFSIPYMPSNGRFITLTTSRIKDMAQLKGKKMGTLKEEDDTGVFRTYLQANYFNSFEIVDFEDITNLLASLDNNGIQAGLLHATAVNYWVTNSGGRLSPIGPSFTLGDGYTMMALPTRQVLINNVNEQIKQIRASKEFETLYKTYLDGHE